MQSRTPLYSRHKTLGARFVAFGDWEMPLHYGSQLQEHLAVRRHAGVFDVSHMRAIDLVGGDATNLLRRLLANDVARLDRPGRALYTCMLNHSGGVLDDLIVYRIGDLKYRLVVNAGSADRDLAWIRLHQPSGDLDVAPQRALAILAVQGPNAREHVVKLFDDATASRVLEIPRFGLMELDDSRSGLIIARTGYTGEDGFEIMLPAERVESMWDEIIALGVSPCGLGARDTLRLEAGFCLYGNELDELATPLESGLSWTISWDPPREFIGRTALETQRQSGPPNVLRGILLEGRGILRNHLTVYSGESVVGYTTSGSYSPTLGRSIALARIDARHHEHLAVDLRGARQPVRIVPLPFVRA